MRTWGLHFRAFFVFNQNFKALRTVAGTKTNQTAAEKVALISHWKPCKQFFLLVLFCFVVVVFFLFVLVLFLFFHLFFVFVFVFFFLLLKNSPHLSSLFLFIYSTNNLRKDNPLITLLMNLLLVVFIHRSVQGGMYLDGAAAHTLAQEVSSIFYDRWKTDEQN